MLSAITLIVFKINIFRSLLDFDKKELSTSIKRCESLQSLEQLAFFIRSFIVYRPIPIKELSIISMKMIVDHQESAI